ncbi:MAG: hypothetical protein ACRBB0_15260 [Pelagimonas sp.]|uniref:hypothetical protein n=1 Tax=Pelagimonas sp. TaxID=2073170 RepID=UPI003D6BA6FC
METPIQDEVAPQLEATPEAVSEATAPEVETPAEAEADGAGAPSEGDADQTKADTGKSRHQRRREAMERLRSEKEQISAKLAETEARLEEYEGNLSSPRPVEANFQSFEEYQAALAGYEAVRQLDGRQKAQIERERAAQQSQAERIEQQTETEIAQGWQSQVEDAKTRYKDFEKVAFTAPISEEVGKVVAQMDQGADVAYHLGLNPAEATRISQLPPHSAAVELGKIEATLTAPQPRTTTQAPDPVSPVKAKATATKDPEKMTADEYDKWREAGGTF